MRARLLLLGLLVGLIALLPASVHAALPGAGTVSQATPDVLVDRWAVPDLEPVRPLPRRSTRRATPTR